ncbi:MAG: hypothetical protein WCT28_03670 [Patescibacteria group bacterium]|jgi:hypothetical protein
MKKNILEIGPGVRPMHHRSQKEFVLSDDEHYTGIEQGQIIFENPIWHRIKERYGNRVKVFTGDQKELTQIESDSIDELVALGTSDKSDKTLSEFKRVLRTGGLFILGTMSVGANAWKLTLLQAGFTELPELENSYNLFPRAGIPDRPYTVMSFRKH